MIRELVKRYKQGVHPCLLWFLIQYYYDNETEAVYDGNHILTDLDLFPVEGSHFPLWKYGYEHLTSSFYLLNDDEKRLLKEYIDEFIFNNK
jgi:hypothetical protein